MTSGTGNWEQLVSTALLGTERRAVEPATWAGPAAKLAGRPATEALLGAAAMADAGRVAGARPARAPELGTPAPEDEIPAAGPAAAPRLAALLQGRDRELVEAMLRDLAGVGRRVPDECLPALLEIATRSVLPAELVGAVLGRRGRWLAQFRPAWAAAVAWLTEDRPAGSAVAEPVDAEAPGWRLGSTAERVQWLVQARRRDPLAARTVLASGWEKEKAADRVLFVEALATGLEPADEVFLEQALEDRSEKVRHAARELLLALPGSGLQQRVAERAAGYVQLENGLLRRSKIVVTPPESGPGKSAQDVLRTLVAAAPLATWIPRLGSSPAEVVGRPIAEQWGPVLHQAWLLAAQRERDPEWGYALLASADADHRDDALQLVPAETRYALVAGWLRSGPVTHPAALLQACPPPWPDELTAAVVGMAGLDPSDGRGLSQRLARLAGLRARPGAVDGVHRVAEALRAEDPDQHHLATIATLLTNRRRLIEESR